MLVLYIVLVLSTLAVAGVALAFVWRVRRHARRTAGQPDETARLLRRLDQAKRQDPEDHA